MVVFSCDRLQGPRIENERESVLLFRHKIFVEKGFLAVWQTLMDDIYYTLHAHSNRYTSMYVKKPRNFVDVQCKV